MLYVVLVPWPMWVAILLGTWAAMAYIALGRIRLFHPLMVGLLLVMAVQMVSASTSAVATSFDPIGRFACLMGNRGMWISILVAVPGACVIGFLYRRWPATPHGQKRYFRAWIANWLIFSLFSILAHMRSAGLCTV